MYAQAIKSLTFENIRSFYDIGDDLDIDMRLVTSGGPLKASLYP